MGISRRSRPCPKASRSARPGCVRAPQGRSSPSGLAPGLFYLARPERIEKIVTTTKPRTRRDGQARKRGITPVVVPDDDPDHNPGGRAGRGRPRPGRSVFSCLVTDHASSFRARPALALIIAGGVLITAGDSRLAASPSQLGGHQAPGAGAVSRKHISQQQIRQAALALRNAEGDLVKLADLAVLAKLRAEPDSTVHDWIDTALVNVRTALELMDRGDAKP